MGDQRLEAHLPCRNEFEKRLHVALFCPAYVPERVIVPMFLVGGVVASWAVGHGEAQVQLLLIVRFARHIHSHRADHHHPPLFARDLAGDFDGTVVLGAGCDDHRIHAMAVEKRSRLHPQDQRTWLPDPLPTHAPIATWIDRHRIPTHGNRRPSTIARSVDLKDRGRSPRCGRRVGVPPGGRPGERLHPVSQRRHLRNRPPSGIFTQRCFGT
jgi:hypothetical protein